MTKDAEKLLKFIVDESKHHNNVEVEVNVSAIKNIPNIQYSKNKLLNELEEAGVICGYKENILGEISVYLTTDGLEYFDNLNRDVNPSSIVFNVSGGQVNIANDNAKIEANVDPYWSNNEKSVTAENKIDKETSSSLDTQNGKVFISYSWTPESNKKWVEKLAHRLEEDGVQVVIDFKDLKFGHDKFVFMERTVNDETIKKVLIICNRTYKEKADDRIGGVGDESAIITSQVYGKVRQEKFIPVVNEYDENGNPYLPNYLASRMYADLTDFEKGYRELLYNINEKKIPTDIEKFNAPTHFFEHRIRKAFPGIRGIKEFTDPKECVDRLEILLKNPLVKSEQKMRDPIWWFRGSINSPIKRILRVSPTKFLMNNDEIEVKKIIVFGSDSYFRNFVYVEIYPEKSIGIYGEIDQRVLIQKIKSHKEFIEQYAIYEDKIIREEEYEDGAAVIDGKVVDIEGKAELRLRYLTPYNFIICAKWNPFNNSIYDERVENILNDMLDGIKNIDDLVTLFEKIPRHEYDIYD